MAEKISIYQDIDLSLTENLIPPVVHVKQFDHLSRKIRCTLYLAGTEYVIPNGSIVSYSGTRPDGKVFQYSSEAQGYVSVEENAVIFTITEFMTAHYGRFPVDIVLLNEDGDVLGTFCLVLRVERAAIRNGKIATLTHDKAAVAVGAGITECLTTEDGYFAVVSNDGLGLTEGSESSTMRNITGDLVNTTITESGYLSFETDGLLGLGFATDEDGRIVVEYGKKPEKD